MKLLLLLLVGLVSACSLSANDGDRTITFSTEFQLPDGVNPEDVSLSFPKLKYNKKLLVSYITDDSGQSYFSSAFSYTNKKWIDDMTHIPNPNEGDRVFFYHKDGERTTGYYPKRFLTFTDGAGIDHRFTFSQACFPAAREVGSGKIIMDNDNPSKFVPYTTFNELAYMLDFGCHPNLHDVENDDPEDPVSVSEGINECYDILYDKMGYKVKTMARPNGNDIYVYASRMNEHMKVILTEENGFGNPEYPPIEPKPLTYYMRDGLDLDKQSHLFVRLSRNTNEGMFSDSAIIERLSDLRDGDENERYWFCWVTHEAYQSQISLLDLVYDNFGKGGDDCLWFSTADEYYEYWYMTSKADVQKVVDGRKVKFTVSVPVGDDFYHCDLSFMLSGIPSAENVTVTSSSNVYGISYAMNEGQLLVNVNFDDRLPARAEKYTSLFESTKIVEDYEDAMYFISQLKTGVRDPYLARTDRIAAINLDGFSINGGATETQSRAVDISYTAQSEFEATHYQLAESMEELTEWLPVEDPISFILKDMVGEHTVYFRVRNQFTESGVQSRTINYKEVPGALNSISINSGVGDTYKINVKVKLELQGVLPISYLISENPSFSGAEWISFSTAIVPFELSSSFGVKTVYAKVKFEDNQESSVCSSSIELKVYPRMAVIGLGRLVDSNDKEIVNGLLLNNTGSTFSSSLGTIDIYDTEGNEWFGMVKNKSSIPAGVLARYGITEALAGSTISNDNITFDEPDAGVYPDRFIKVGYLFTNANTTGQARNCFVFTGVPNGTYNVRILPARDNVRSSYQDNNYQVNGSPAQQPGFELWKNNQVFLEFNDISVDDNTILVSSWKQGGGWGYEVPLNLIEISTGGTPTGISKVNTTDGLTVISGKDKLSIHAEKGRNISIHSIEGVLVKRFVMKDVVADVTLPEGVYLVNGKKGMVIR